MKTNSLFWAMSWVAVGSFAIMQGCGGDDDDGGDGSSTGGKGGSSGSGTGGSATGGKGGTNTGGSATGGSATGGAGGAPGGAGGESSGGEGGGGQTRGEVCVDYCEAYFTNGCNSSTTNPANSYTDQTTCEFVCANSAWELGSPGEVGNTVWCRLDHANNAAAAAMRTLHCGHASENSTGVCL